jgi:hypothetical protein
MSSPVLPRLRQVALVANDLDAACAAIESKLSELSLGGPFHDPGIEVFGLANAVYEVDDTFLEVVSPQREDTTAGRYLDRRGGDASYMAIFQVAETTTARSRVEALGLRTAWQVDLDDISATHLHPKDVPGAIVSFDSPRPVESWRWAGPRWTGGAPGDRQGSTGGISGLVVRLLDVEEGARTWAAVLDERLVDGTLVLDGGRQQVRFETASDPGDEGIVVVEVDGLQSEHVVCGVRFRSPHRG